ncbi:hypothetical protein [Algoriphagus marinus]|uniref:hypothetical protein n=1 Tax=Algoriphagus marinus TaxID=1925762 RepID=UPI001FEA788E|nr:hypothetical protein [Algoriphagus marinus]
MANWVGERLFAQLLSYTVIAAELVLGLWAISGKKQIQFAAIILCFHFSVLIFTFGKLSLIYMYLMAVTSILILPMGLKFKEKLIL